MFRPFLLAAAICVSTIASDVSAQQAGAGPPLRETADRQYDPGTVQTVSGRILSIERRDGIHLVLDTGAEPIRVHLGPAWFVESRAMTLEAGQEIEVIGSLIATDEGFALVASRVRRGADTLTFRDEDGVPAWSGRRAARSERRGLAIASPTWVAGHLDDDGIRILDVRGDYRAYLRGHVPGAVHFPAAALRGPERGLPVQYRSPEALAQIFGQAGVMRDHHVLVYADDLGVLDATMTAYCLRRIGQEHVSIMDGGYASYAAGHPTTQQFPEYDAGWLSPVEDRTMVVTLEELKSLVGRPGVKLVDARSSEAFEGGGKMFQRNGHIPGAINLDWRRLVERRNAHVFKSRRQIEAIVDAIGIDRDDDIIVYCGTGKEATLAYTALARVLGYPRVRVYEGSWTEYAAHPELPVER